MKKNSLLKNYIYNWISQILTLLVPLITAPYLARVLHEAGNGQITFVNSIVAYFVSFAGFGFSVYGQREIAKHQDKREERSRIFLEIFAIKCIFSLLSIIVLVFMIGISVFPKSYTVLVLLDAIQVIAVVFDIQFYYQGMENFRAIAIRTIVLRLAVIISVFIFVKNESDVWKYLLLFSLSILIANISMWPSMINSIDWYEIKSMSLVRHLKPSFLIFLPVISGTILSVIDATMIGFLSTNADYENGCYGSALKLVNMITLLVTVDSQVLASRNTSDYSRNDIISLRRHLKFGFDYVWILACPLIVGLLLLSKHLTCWFFGSGYEKVPMLLNVFTIRLLAQGLIFVIGNQYFIVTGREKLCTIINFIGIACNIVLNSILIPLGGSIGASTASVLAELLMVAIYYYHFTRDSVGATVQLFSSAPRYAISSVIMGIPIYFLSKFTGYTFISFILITCFGILVYALLLYMFHDEFFMRYIKRILKLP